MVALALIVALCIGGGVSFAAENAVPGDALYVVKTEVNENVRAALAVSSEAEARWHAKAAMRRLAEAKELNARGELSADVAAELATQFTSEAEAALEGAQELETEGNTDASADITAELESAVSMYADLFSRTSASGETSARAFVLPHVLEKSGVTIRENASGQTSGNVIISDVDGDGDVEVRVGPSGVKSEISAEAEGGGSAEAGSNTKIEGTTKVEIDL